AHVALLHHPGCGVELGRPVRTGPLAVPTTDALLRVDVDDAILLPLDHGPGGADVHARGFLTVHARGGEVVGEDPDRLLKTVLDRPVAAPVLAHQSQADTDGEVVGILAGHLARLAADTGAGIEIPRHLFHDLSHPSSMESLPFDDLQRPLMVRLQGWPRPL